MTGPSVTLLRIDRASSRVRWRRSERSGPWTIVGGIWILIVAANAYYIVPASVLSLIMDRLAVEPASASLLVSVMFGTQMVLGVPIGVLLDRIDNRRSIVVATGFLIVVYAWSGWSAATDAYWPLLASRAVAAPATAAIWTAGVNVIGRTFDPAHRATAVGVFSGGPAAGFALGLLSGPPIADRFGWSAIFVVYAVPAVIGCAAFWIASRRIDISGGDTDVPRAVDFKRLLTDRPVWGVALMAFLGFSLYAFVTSWVPTYLTEEFGVSLAQGGVLVALFPAIGIFARGGSGAVSDRLFDHRRRPVAIASFAAAAPTILLIAVVETVVLVFLALVIAGLFVQLGIGLFYAQARELADPNVAATGVAFTTSMAMFGGFSAPLVGGLLIEYSGYLAAFGYAVVVALVGLALAWITPEPDL